MLEQFLNQFVLGKADSQASVRVDTVSTREGAYAINSMEPVGMRNFMVWLLNSSNHPSSLKETINENGALAQDNLSIAGR